MPAKTLYERLGGAFAIAAIVDHFSEHLLENRAAGRGSKNPKLREWHVNEYEGRLQGLKFMRTLWLCAVSGGPFEYSGKSMRDAHQALQIAPEEFDEVAEELGRSLDHFRVPAREREEVLAAFMQQKPDVTYGSAARLQAILQAGA